MTPSDPYQPSFTEFPTFTPPDAPEYDRPAEPVYDDSAYHTEGALLASLMLDPSHLPSVAARLAPQDFTDSTARAIYEALLDMQRKGLLIDRATITAYFIASGIAKKKMG